MELTALARFVGALGVVLGLIVLCAYAARRFGFMQGGGGARRARRLGLVEGLPIGAKHRLVLVQRDGCEHLVLLGPNGDLLIESGIAAPVPAESGPESAEAEANP